MTTRELVVRMSMAGLGKPHEIWAWPFHYFMAVRREYLKIQGVLTDQPAEEPQEIAPGITVEHYEY